MESLSCIIAGCARDNERDLPQTLSKIDQIRKLWKESAVIIVENDSRDATKTILAGYSNVDSSKNTHILTFDGISSELPSRTDRIAFARNKIISFIHEHPVYSSFDYILMVDMDGGIHRFSEKSLNLCFAADMPQWDALFSNNIGPYYDIWALRCNASSFDITFDCWDMYMHLLQLGACNPQQARERCITRYQKPIPINSPPIEVQSAFGGLGLYRLSKTKGCVYNGKTTFCSCRTLLSLPDTVHPPCRPDTCEHVSFHRDMIEKHNAKLFIFPRLLTMTQSEHISNPSST